MNDQVPSIVLKGLAELIESYGQSPSGLAKRVGLNPEALISQHLMISEVAVNDLFEEASKACGDRYLCLKLARKKGFETLGEVWLRMQRADTVGEMLAIVAANLEMHSRGLSVYLIRGAGGISINVEVRKLELSEFQKQPLNEGTTQMIEHCLAIISHTLTKLIGSKWRPSYVQFRYAKPREITPLEDVFGSKLFFNQDVNAIHISTADWHRPYIAEHPCITTDLADWHKETSLPFAIRVDGIIRQQINTGCCEASLVAQELRMPVRTMQYKLEKENTSFRRIYNDVRLEFAKYYIRYSDLPVIAIAERLHFSSLAAFSKFFKLNAGLPPTVYVQKRD